MLIAHPKLSARLSDCKHAPVSKPHQAGMISRSSRGLIRKRSRFHCKTNPGKSCRDLRRQAQSSKDAIQLEDVRNQAQSIGVWTA